VSELGADERAELVALRERVAALEAERAEEIARATAAVAAAQERAYWLDRWHLDLNALMATAWGERVRLALRIARAPVRRVKLARHQLATIGRSLRRR
jgi:hypothetical protein